MRPFNVTRDVVRVSEANSIVAGPSLHDSELSTSTVFVGAARESRAYRLLMTSSDFARFLSLSDVAEILGVAITDVKALVESGELASIRVGDSGARRIQTDELDAFIAHRYEAERRLLRIRQAEFSNVTDFADGRII